MTTTTLKLTALLLMLIDHIGEFIPGMPVIFRILGRISAPIFIFCAVWGFHYTRSRKIYLTRMYLCSAFMGLLDCALNISIPQPYVPCYNNIFSTLFVICLFIYLWEKQDRLWKKALMVLLFLVFNMAAFLAGNTLSSLMTGLLQQDYATCSTIGIGLVPNLLTCEGSYFVVIMGLVLYFCKESRKKLCWGYGIYCLAYFGLLLPALFAGLDMPWWRYLFVEAIQWMQIFALPLMLCYNGQRGRNLKYLFYIFYPAHIVLLFYLGNLLAGIQ